MNICQIEESECKKLAAFCCFLSPKSVSRFCAGWWKIPTGSVQMDYILSPFYYSRKLPKLIFTTLWLKPCISYASELYIQNNKSFTESCHKVQLFLPVTRVQRQWIWMHIPVTAGLGFGNHSIMSSSLYLTLGETILLQQRLMLLGLALSYKGFSCSMVQEKHRCTYMETQGISLFFNTYIQYYIVHISKLSICSM